MLDCLRLSEKTLVKEILEAQQSDEAGIYEQRLRVGQLKQKLSAVKSPEAKNLLSIADNLVKKSVWIMGGDGWAYDIGYGGLDHVLASGKNVNILVLDTEVYSNTGGQMSKSTSRGAVAKFAAAGKSMGKKNLAMLAMTYGNVYVASVAMGANDAQTVRAFLEAEAYDGPSIIIAYSHCIAHGIDMGKGMNNQRDRRRDGLLAPVPVQSKQYRRGKESVQTRFEGTKTAATGVHAIGNPLQDTGKESS